MIASRIGRAGTRFGPTRFGGSNSARIGSISAHSSSGTRQIGGRGARACLRPGIRHLLLSSRRSPHASLEIGSLVGSQPKEITVAKEVRTEHPHIVMTEGYCGGRPRIEGTRISVEFIARF